jgi:ankyrin repeat protein
MRDRIARILVAAGALLGVADNEGDTPLHVAIAVASDKQTAALALYLAAQGAPLDIPNKAGQTPLQAAGENAAMLKSAAIGGDMDVDQ